MRKIFIFILVLGCFSAIPFIRTNKNINSANAYCLVDENRSGCCSRHGGVCGCNQKTHQQKCCDGSLSPSCGC